MTARDGTIRAGDIVRFKGGFTCMRINEVFAVHADGAGDLFVDCSNGRHYIYLEEEQIDQFDCFTVLAIGNAS